MESPRRSSDFDQSPGRELGKKDSRGSGLPTPTSEKSKKKRSGPNSAAGSNSNSPRMSTMEGFSRTPPNGTQSSQWADVTETVASNELSKEKQKQDSSTLEQAVHDSKQKTEKEEDQGVTLSRNGKFTKSWSVDDITELTGPPTPHEQAGSTEGVDGRRLSVRSSMSEMTMAEGMSPVKKAYTKNKLNKVDGVDVDDDAALSKYKTSLRLTGMR